MVPGFLQSEMLERRSVRHRPSLGLESAYLATSSGTIRLNIPDMRPKTLGRLRSRIGAQTLG
jgi:hypothetical protein